MGSVSWDNIAKLATLGHPPRMQQCIITTKNALQLCESKCEAKSKSRSKTISAPYNIAHSAQQQFDHLSLAFCVIAQINVMLFTVDSDLLKTLDPDRHNLKGHQARPKRSAGLPIRLSLDLGSIGGRSTRSRRVSACNSCCTSVT